MSAPTNDPTEEQGGLPSAFPADIPVGGTLDATDPKTAWTPFRKLLALMATPAS